MRHKTRTEIENLLREYPRYESYIKNQEEKILFPDSTRMDENIGGGSGGYISDPTGTKAATLVEDKVLKELQKERDAVDKTLRESHLEAVTIIDEYYFKRPRTKTWDGIAVDMSLSKSTCLRIRNEFFNRLADELGKMK